MSDGLTDGYRSARAYEARQKTIDAFFEMVLLTFEKTEAKVSPRYFRAAFDAFDAHRYADNIASHRIAKERGKRWEAFLSLLDDAAGKRSDLAVGKAWAEILSLALRFASQDITEKLRAASAFKSCRIALYVPNGTGHWGRNAPTLLGDFEGALDAIAAEPFDRPGLCVIIVEDPDRAVVGLTAGAGRSEENREEERAKLRFLAVEKR